MHAGMAFLKVRWLDSRRAASRRENGSRNERTCLKHSRGGSESSDAWSVAGAAAAPAARAAAAARLAASVDILAALLRADGGGATTTTQHNRKATKHSRGKMRAIYNAGGLEYTIVSEQNRSTFREASVFHTHRGCSFRTGKQAQTTRCASHVLGERRRRVVCVVVKPLHHETPCRLCLGRRRAPPICHPS